MRYGIKWPQYAKQWDAMKIKPLRQREFDAMATKILAHKSRYKAIETATGVPWYMVGLLHMRESNCNFDTYLGNGQSLHRRTTIVPRGRGPFNSFEEGAIDALKIDGLTSVKDWRLEKVLYFMEQFNGAGYDMRGLPSPYLWGGTNQQRAGKFIRDGVFSRTTWDPQPGTAPILATIARLDPTIQFERES